MHRIVTLACTSLLLACSAERAPLLADNVVVTPAIPGTGMRAAYLTLTNTTSKPITISRVISPDYGIVEIHESLLENGVSRMRELKEITVPPRGSYKFEPAGNHLMLMQPAGSGDTVMLQFYSADSLVLSLGATIKK